MQPKKGVSLPSGKANSAMNVTSKPLSSFKNVPRDFFYRAYEREISKMPKPNTYRPRFELT